MRTSLNQHARQDTGCVKNGSGGRLRDLASNGDETRGDRIDEFVRAGIARLWSMQTVSGGLSYWPGGSEAAKWGSAYAGIVLGHARQKGYAVDEGFVSDLARYLERVLKDHCGRTSDNVKALICRVLTGFDRPPRGWMSVLSERLDHLDMAGRAHLAGAWLAAGRRDRAIEVLPDDMIGQTLHTATSGRITSQVHQVGTLLSVLMDLNPDHARAATLARTLESSRTDGHWNNTQENAAAFVAMARYRQGQDAITSEFSGTVSSDGIARGAFGSERAATISVHHREGQILLTSTGTGSIFVVGTTEGLLKHGEVEPYDRGLQVRRRWLDSDAKPVDPTSLHVGDLVQVEISVSAPQLKTYDTIGNIAIVDALPGGMEVENPRLSTSARRGRLHGSPDHIEFLDDRVLAFTSVGRKERVFCYALRAITAGSFEIPPIQASSMYDPSFASLQIDTRRVEIKK